MKTVFLFSGQGTQYFHMAAGLLQNHAPFRQTLATFTSVASDILGSSLHQVIYEQSKRKSDNFSEPRLSNAALLTVECALAQLLRDSGISPDIVCGMSLGEYAAAVVAGSLDFEKAVQMVADTGSAFVENCQPGSIVAVLDNVALYHRTPSLQQRAEVIFESPDSHFVLAGAAQPMQSVQEELKNAGVVVQALPVAFGYHSANIDPARAAYQRILDTAFFARPKLPVYSSATGGPVERLNGAHFWRTARGPMRLLEAIEALPTTHRYRFIDLGPTGTIANVLRRHRGAHTNSTVFPLVTPFGNGHVNFEKLMREFSSGSAASGETSAVARVSAQPSTPRAKSALLFPGQGSQVRGMGADLFPRYPELVARADRLLGYSSEQLCLEDPQRQLNKTQFTQPALFVVNALHYQDHLKSGRLPDYVAGHSLGEYSALYAAGAIDFETGLALVEKRGALMAQATNGGMAAVLGLDEEAVREVLQTNRLHEIDLANINSPFQTVVSGPRAAIIAAQSHFERAGCKEYIPLNVSGAFHSRLMKDAAREFAEFAGACRFGRLQLPVIANRSARPYTDAGIVDNLAGQITEPVRWTDTLGYLDARGVQDIVEIGPGQVLTRLLASYRRTPHARAVARHEQH